MMLILLFSLSTYLLFLVIDMGHKKFQNYQRHHHYSVDFQDDIMKLSSRIHHVLSTVGLSHFLCYDALWGQIHYSRVVPWKSSIEFCLLNEQISKIDEVLFTRVFKKHGLKINYDSSEGVYTVKDRRMENGKVILIVFEEDVLAKMMRRIGWKRRVLPPDCEISTLECFPSRLISPPLPVKQFGKYMLPVPKEGIEIQKYHFPNDWWKYNLHKNCSEKEI